MSQGEPFLAMSYERERVVCVTQTLICLVRHGVTDWNYDGRAQGHVDIPLSPEGHRQAEAAAERLAKEPWDAIYSSTLSRAYETALAIARKAGHNEVRQEAGLIERDMGPAEGSSPSERAKRWPGVAWLDVPGIESDEALGKRAVAALTEIARRHPGQRIMCVAHGALIHCFLRAIIPPGATPLGGGHQRNTAITPVGFDGERFTQLAPSDHSHILEDGIEYSGEKGRHWGGALSDLLGMPLTPEAQFSLVFGATAVESAWHGHQLVAFLRAFTDGALYGYVDISAAAPGFEHLLPKLMKRLRTRYPDVAFTTLPGPAQERSGD